MPFNSVRYPLWPFTTTIGMSSRFRSVLMLTKATELGPHTTRVYRRLLLMCPGYVNLFIKARLVLQIRFFGKGIGVQ